MKILRVLVIGKKGQLAQSIKKLIDIKKVNFDFYFSQREDLNIEDLDNIRDYFQNNFFDILINCASFNRVDKAEADYELANQINHLAVKEIASIANKKNMKFIHISTNYVFDGKKNQPYLETDKALPLNEYGKSKLAGENAVLSLMKSNALILRTSWLYSEFGDNFVKTILNHTKKNKSISIVGDQYGSPTNAFDLAKVILTIIQSNEFIIKNKPSKIYNYSNDGICSWFEFASEVVNITGIKCTLNPIKTEEYPLPAQRPKYSVLSNKLIKKEFDVNINHWKESLKVCLKNL